MSLSYLDTDLTEGSLALKRHLGNAKRAAVHLKAELFSSYCEVTSSPYFRPAAMRVTSALAVSFVLVRCAKHLLT